MAGFDQLIKTQPSPSDNWISNDDTDTSISNYEMITALSTLFQLYCGSQFYWWRKQEYQEKTIDLPHTLSHNVVLRKFFEGD